MSSTIRPLAGRSRRTPAWFALFAAGTDAARPLRDRVCDAIRGAIRSRRVAHGDRLPSTRTLAADLKVSRITAEAAYRQLESEGYVRRRIGDGTFVEIDVGVEPGPAALRTPPRPKAPRVPVSRRGTLILGRGGCSDPRGALAFSAGFPDLAEFPIDTWKRLTARRLRGGAATLGYGDPAGEPALRQEIANYLAQSRGVRCSADQVLVLASSQQALQLVAMLLTDAGDTVWIEDPGYRGAQTALAALGATLSPIPVDGDGMVVPRRKAAPIPRLAYVTPSHQYPTGVTLSLARRLQLIDRVGAGHGWIVEDDYDSEYQYDARPVPAMHGLDPRGRVVYLGTFSKVLFPSLRLAYLVLPSSLVAAFITARTTFDGHPARLSQLVTADFMAGGHFAAHVRRMRNLYHHQRDLLLSEIQQRLDPWCRPIGTSAGLQLTVALPEGREAALTTLAARAGVMTPGVSGLFLSRPRLDGWVLGFAALGDDEIVEGVRRLAGCVGRDARYRAAMPSS